MARTDLVRLKKYEGAFEAAAMKHGVPPALLAAIASRESRAGAALDSSGRGDGGNGFGLMQVDRRYHPPRGGPYSAEHIDQAAGLKEGSRGPAVKELQQKLGFELGTPDGVFDPKTESAVKRFQTKHHLEADGIAGPKTQAALKKALAERARKPRDSDSFEPGKDKWKDAPSLADTSSASSCRRSAPVVLRVGAAPMMQGG